MLAASRSLTALLGFILGATLATLMDPPIQTQARSGPYLRWLLLIEIAFLGACAVVWRASPDPIQGARLYAVILLFAVSMGIQGAAARRINSARIRTIVFTTLPISIVASLTRMLFQRTGVATSEAVSRASVAFAAYCCGAALAGVLVTPYFEWLLWMPVVAVLLALGCWKLGRKRKGDWHESRNHRSRRGRRRARLGIRHIPIFHHFRTAVSGHHRRFHVSCRF